MGLWVAASRETLTVLPVLLLSFIYGCKVGYTQAAEALFKSDKAPFPATADDISWMQSVSYTTAWISVVICFFFGDVVGRKVFLCGSLLMYLIIWIAFLFTSSSLVIIIGIGVYGIAASMHAIMGYVYIGEVTSPQNREFLGISYWLAMLIGIELQYLVSTLFDDYRALIIFPLAMVVLTGVTFLFMRESPYFLISRGQTDKAVAVQAWLSDQTEEEVRAGDLDNMIEYTRAKNGRTGNFSEMFSKANLTILGLMVWINGSPMVNSGNVVQQSGEKVMAEYSQFMNLKNFVHVFNMISILGAIMSFINVKFIGRQVLLLVGFTLVVLCHLMSALCQAIEREYKYDIRDLAYVIAGLHCLTWFMAAATIMGGLGLLKTEIFPAHLKEFFNALLAFSGDAFGFVVVKTFSFLAESIGKEVVFLMYGAFNALGLFFVFVAMRETKNKTLYEIQNEYTEKRDNQHQDVS